MEIKDFNDEKEVFNTNKNDNVKKECQKAMSIAVKLERNCKSTVAMPGFLLTGNF